MSSPKQEDRVIIKGEQRAASVWERQQFVRLLTRIAMRLRQEKRDDERKSA